MGQISEAHTHTHTIHTAITGNHVSQNTVYNEFGIVIISEKTTVNMKTFPTETDIHAFILLNFYLINQITCTHLPFIILGSKTESAI